MRNLTRAPVRQGAVHGHWENMPDPVLPDGHEQRRSAIAATDGGVEPATNGEFRRRLHDAVDHAALPCGYTLAAGSGRAMLATAHGRFDTARHRGAETDPRPVLNQRRGGLGGQLLLTRPWSAARPPDAL